MGSYDIKGYKTIEEWEELDFHLIDDGITRKKDAVQIAKQTILHPDFIIATVSGSGYQFDYHETFCKHPMIEALIYEHSGYPSNIVIKDLPLYIGIHPELDKLIARTLSNAKV